LNCNDLLQLDRNCTRRLIRHCKCQLLKTIQHQYCYRYINNTVNRTGSESLEVNSKLAEDGTRCSISGSCNTRLAECRLLAMPAVSHRTGFSMCVVQPLEAVSQCHLSTHQPYALHSTRRHRQSLSPARQSINPDGTELGTTYG